MTYANLLVRRDGAVAVITLNRPNALNALNTALMNELSTAIAAFEVSLAEGVRFERRVFHSLFATEDQKEGMAAFIEKRAPKFRNR